MAELWAGLIGLLFLFAVLALVYKLYRLFTTPISSYDGSPQRAPNESQGPDIDEQDLSTKIYQAADIDVNDNVLDTSDALRNLTSRIRSLEDSMETTSILRQQKELVEEDLKKHITGYNLSILKMAVSDLIDAYEYAIEAEEMLEKSSSPESSEIKQYLKPVSMYLKQGLAAVGIEQFSPDTEMPYLSAPGCDLSRRTPTADEDFVGLISEVEKAGWRSTLPDDSTQKEILRNAQVSVYELVEN